MMTWRTKNTARQAARLHAVELEARAITTRELRGIEQAAAVLTALATLIEQDPTPSYAQQLRDHAEVLHSLARRQPQARDPSWEGVSAVEHATEIGLFITTRIS